MKYTFSFCFMLLAAIFCGGIHARAQEGYPAPMEETADNIQNAEGYLRSRTRSLEKYLHRSARIQKRLLKKMKVTESGMAAKLIKTDSPLYLEYAKYPMAYDFLLALSPDSIHHNKGSPKSDTKIDSLKKIQKFLKSEYTKLNAGTAAIPKKVIPPGYSEKLQRLQSELQFQNQIQSQLDARAQQLKTLFGDRNAAGMRSLQKAVYYASEKRKAWKQLSEDPDAAEEKALEYLQGIEGFDNYFKTKNNSAFGGLGNQASAEDLARLGYQTKGHTQKLMQDKFGSDLGDIQVKMGEQLQQYKEQLNTVKGKMKEVKGKYGEATSQLKAAKGKIKNLSKSQFKINPMRSLPFRMRLKYAYNFQTLKAINEQQPTILQLGTSVIYRQTEKWRFGLGMTARVGLGENWQNLRLSYEGVQFRAFTDWDLGYGFRMEGGVGQLLGPERSVVGDLPQQGAIKQDFFKKAFGKQERTAYLGLMKTYKINKKWKGTFLLGYDFLWGIYGKRTPLMIRLGWEK